MAPTAVTAIPAATTIIVADGERAPRSNPASSEPSGTTPQAICRATLLVRPSISFGVICIRYVWTETFQDGPTKPNTATIGHSHSGTRTSTTSVSKIAQVHMQPVMMTPAGILR